jgi:hypothetical protein
MNDTLLAARQRLDEAIGEPDVNGLVARNYGSVALWRRRGYVPIDNGYEVDDPVWVNRHGARIKLGRFVSMTASFSDVPGLYAPDCRVKLGFVRLPQALAPYVVDKALEFAAKNPLKSQVAV